MSHWRVGSKVPINVYDGDRPVCQCHNIGDAELIVKAVNNERRREVLPTEAEQVIAALRKALEKA